MEALIEQSKKRIRDLENEIDKEKQILQKNLKDSKLEICKTCKFDKVRSKCNACGSKLCFDCLEDVITKNGVFIVCKYNFICKNTINFKEGN